MSLLPLEVIDELLENFSGNEAAQSKCALVSRDWLDRVRLRRFSHVRLRIGRGASSSSTNPRIAIEKFYGVLDASPPAASYVQSFTLERPTPKYLEVVPPNGCSGFQFHRLPNIRRLQLTNIRFISLTHLFDVLASIPALEELVLEEVSSVMMEHTRDSGEELALGDMRTTARMFPCKLKTLRIPRVPRSVQPQALSDRDVTAFAMGLLEGSALSSLRTLEVLYGIVTCAGWLPVIPRLAPSLQNLAVRVNDAVPTKDRSYARHTQDAVNAIAACLSLRSLTVLYNVPKTYIEQDPLTNSHHIGEVPITAYQLSPVFFHALARALSGQVRPLERLNLVFVCSAYELHAAAVLRAVAKLARALGTRTCFPKFSHVSVRVEEPDDRLARRGHAAIEEALRQTRAMFEPFALAGVPVDVEITQKELGAARGLW